MTTGLRRWRRTLAIASVVTTTAALSGALNWTVSTASAAFDTLPWETAFEIDGDPDVETGQDWLSDPTVATNLRDAPWEQPEVCDNNPVTLPDGEVITDDTTAVIPGTSLDEYLFDGTQVTDTQVLRKGDLCSIYRTWELVFVPDAGNPDPNAGQYHFIFYGGWSRPDVNGEIDVYFPLYGGQPGRADDLLIQYDFEDNTDDTNVIVLEFNGTTWVPMTDPVEWEAQTGRGVQVAGNSFTFGEFAINLTVTGILPENGPCTTFTAGDPITRTGNNDTATLKDVVRTTPIQITNCGSLTINKTTRPANPAGAPTFPVTTSELDGKIVQFPSTTELDTVLAPGGSITYTDLNISPDYQVVEGALPAGWTEESLICESFDPIAGVDVTRQLWLDGKNGPDTSFPIAPGEHAVCGIVNVGPPTVVVSKVTVGGAGGPFAIDVTSGTATTPVSISTTQAGTPVAGAPVAVAAGDVTVRESGVATGFYAGDLTCSIDGQTVATGTAVNGVATGVTTPIAAGQQLDCLQQNLAAGSVSVTKAVAGTSTDWSFDFTILPVPPGEAGTKTATAADPTVTWSNLRPGQSYTIAEVDDPDDGFIHGTVDCGGGSGVIAPAPGQTLTCGVTNIELASVAVTKSVEPASATGWSFDFTISPVPDGETATKTATAANPTVSWDGLTPGTAYTITEADAAGYVKGQLSCAGGGATFTPTPGQDVTCTITNLQKASVAVTKSVAPAAETGWSFDFTISPAVDGQPATKTATSASPTVSWDGLTPGTAYTVTEVRTSDLVIGTLTCSGGADSAGSSTFTPAPGQAVTCSITNTRIADIAITKTSSPATVIAGGNVTWTLRVTNTGPSTALDVKLVDPLPAALTLLSFQAPSAWDCSATVTGNPGTLSCSKPDMVPGETWTFTLTTSTAASSAGQSITNTATISTTTTEVTVTNNQDSAAISVEQLAILPPTGNEVAGRLLLAAALVALGGLLVAAQRRRRPA